MSYLREYESISPDHAVERLKLVNTWIRTDWRSFFAELRVERPVFQIPGITLVTRFHDVVEVLTRHAEFSVRPYSGKMDAVVGPFMLGRDNTAFNWRDKSLMRSILSLDDLPCVRTLVKGFVQASLQTITTETIDVVASISRHVPIRLCGEYFGFFGPDEATMKRWSKSIQWHFFKNLTNDPAIAAAAVQSGSELREYLVNEIAELRKQSASGDTALGRMLAVQFPSGLVFNDERIVANAAGLLIGAVETTSQAIVQALDQILRREDVKLQATEAARQNDDTTLDAIVWEALRFDPINPLLFRFVERDTLIAGGTEHATMLKRGSLVFACTASAMHDHRAVEQPDTFTAGRPASRYFHFGFGYHECLGYHVGAAMIPETIKHLLLTPGISRLPGDGSKIDFGGGAFPEKYELAKTATT